MMTRPKSKTTKKRSKKVQKRQLSREAIIKELVEGIVIVDEGREMRHAPTLREMAERAGVAHSYIGKISQENDCARRHARYREAHPEAFDAYDKWHARRQSHAKVRAKTDAQESEASKSENGLRKRRPGHPSRLDNPVPWNEIDRLLVLGENIELPDGTQSVFYPPLREISRRFGVSHSGIVKYWQDHHCERRRETARQRLIDKTEEKLIELRATVIAVSKDDALRIIDKFLTKFEQALDDDRVRYDLPGDFNTMLRLKEFVMGGPDSRQETTTTFTLEMLQERHQRMLRETRQLSQAEQGVIDAPGQEVSAAFETSGDVSTDADNDGEELSAMVSGAKSDGDEPSAVAMESADSDDSDATTSMHPPTRPFGKDAGQQTGQRHPSSDEAEL